MGMKNIFRLIGLIFLVLYFSSGKLFAQNDMKQQAPQKESPKIKIIDSLKKA
jgi:hypothetical protein